MKKMDNTWHKTVLAYASRLLAIWAFPALVACGGATAPPVVDDSLPTVMEKGPGRREKLIAALEELSATFASRDPQRLASLFPFPVPDTVLQFYTDDQHFAEAMDQSKGLLTRQIFLDHFSAISESMMIPELDSLFRILPPAGLATTDTLEKTFLVRENPCARYYRMAVEGETIVLVTGIAANEQYQGDNAEGGSEACESASVWVFYFDGEKLRLKQQGIAG
jgi:hypothetical protein